MSQAMLFSDIKDRLQGKCLEEQWNRQVPRMVTGKKQTCAAGALSSMNGAARLINEASPTPTSLQKQGMH